MVIYMMDIGQTDTRTNHYEWSLSNINLNVAIQLKIGNCSENKLDGVAATSTFFGYSFHPEQNRIQTDSW